MAPSKQATECLCASCRYSIIKQLRKQAKTLKCNAEQIERPTLTTSIDEGCREQWEGHYTLQRDNGTSRLAVPGVIMGTRRNLHSRLKGWPFNACRDHCHRASARLIENSFFVAFMVRPAIYRFGLGLVNHGLFVSLFSLLSIGIKLLLFPPN